MAGSECLVRPKWLRRQWEGSRRGLTCNDHSLPSTVGSRMGCVNMGDVGGQRSGHWGLLGGKCMCWTRLTATLPHFFSSSEWRVEPRALQLLGTEPYFQPGPS